MSHIWLSGKNATDYDLLPELKKAREARAKLKHAILAVSLQKRISKLKVEESDSESDMGDAEGESGGASTGPGAVAEKKPSGNLKKKIKEGVAFQEVVRASLLAAQQKKEALEVDQELEKEAKRRSFQG